MTTADIEAVLRDLYAQHGRLDPAQVVAEARDPGSVLHDRFEWDDSAAAEHYRLQQARALIRSVRIERIVPAQDEQPRMIRAFVHDPVNDGYIATEDVARIPNLRDRVLDEMRGDLERLQRKWNLYKDTFERIALEVLAQSDTVDPPKARVAEKGRAR